MKISKCEHVGCKESAIVLSKSCWDHTKDKIGYIELLVKSLNHASDLTEANLKKVSLNNANIEKACLSGANLSQSDLSGTHFFDCNFNGTDLIGANLSGCDFTHCNMKKADLAKALIANSRLWNSDLTKANLSEANLSGSDMWNTRLFRAKLWHATLSGARSINRKSFSKGSKIFDKICVDESGAISAEEAYRDIKQYFISNGMYNDASWASFKEKTMERIALRKKGDLHYVPSLIMSALCGYGEKPHRIVISAFLAILTFAALYYSFDAVVCSGNNAYVLKWFDYLYYSAITFTTVGYGDFVPKALIISRLLAAIEAFFGVFVTGLFIFTLARKYSAR